MPDRSLLANSVFIFDDDIEVLEERAETDVVLRPPTRYTRQRFSGIKANGTNRNGNE